MNRHKVEIQICTKDLFRNHSPQNTRAMFEAMERAKDAIKAKGAKIRDVTFITEADEVVNPRGDLVRVVYEIFTPYPCSDARLDMQLISIGSEPNLPPWIVPTVEFKYKLEACA